MSGRHTIGGRGHLIVPTQARAAGLHTPVFNEDFVNTAGIDMADARTGGFKFYRNQWWENGVTTLDSISVANSILKLGGGTGRGRLQSAIGTTALNYVGSVFNGNYYLEVRMRFDPLLAGGVSNFGIYLFGIEALYGTAAHNYAEGSQWAGQATDYDNFIEIDPFELHGLAGDNTYNGVTSYQATLHDWSGQFSGGTWAFHIYNSNFSQSVGSVDWTKFHTIGMLIVAQNGTTPGSVQFFFDNIAGNKTYYKGPIGAPPLPGQGAAHSTSTSYDASLSANATTTFAIIDQEHLAIQLDGSPAMPMYCDWVRVWA